LEPEESPSSVEGCSSSSLLSGPKRGRGWRVFACGVPRASRRAFAGGVFVDEVVRKAEGRRLLDEFQKVPSVCWRPLGGEAMLADAAYESGG